MSVNDGDALFDFNTYEEFQKERIEINYENTLKLWYSLPTELPSVDNQRVKEYSRQQQRIRMTKVKIFVCKYLLLKKTFFKQKIRSKGSRLWHTALNLPSTSNQSLFDMYRLLGEVTNEFLTKAEHYDSTINNDELFKASRLLWYMFAFQLQLDLPLILTDSMFGYNMLYPYTDDLVDCNEISKEAKKDFAHIFHKRLLIGEANYDRNNHFDGKQSKMNELELPSSLKPFANRIGKIFDMVKFIENDWKRDEHKGVYRSLATIHECQTKSTLQHARLDDGYTPTMEFIEEISAQKGGASVVAAGFLVEGQLTRTKMAYLEYLGFALQLLDDLQDVREDMKNNHRTIFTQTIFEGRTLDQPTARLIQFLYNTPIYTNFSDELSSEADENITISRYLHISMMMVSVVLVLEAASRLKQYYSPEFYRQLSARSPVKFKNRKKIRVEKRLFFLVRRQLL